MGVWVVYLLLRSPIVSWNFREKTKQIIAIDQMIDSVERKKFPALFLAPFPLLLSSLEGNSSQLNLITARERPHRSRVGGAKRTTNHHPTSEKDQLVNELLCYSNKLVEQSIGL